MEGPLDPQHPGQDAGASQPEAQDGDLHALLERLLGQGDVRPSAPGAGDDLWPDIFASAPAADEVSTIVPAPDAPAAVAELPTAVEEQVAERRRGGRRARSGPRLGAGRRRRRRATTTNVDDIHAAILASVSVELEPIVAPEAAARAGTRPVPLPRARTRAARRSRAVDRSRDSLDARCRSKPRPPT